MNNKILMGIIVVLVVLLAWVWTDRATVSELVEQTGQVEVALDQPPQDGEPGVANDFSVGRPDHRTWVVYEAADMENPHLVVGDAFRIRWTRSDHKLVPLTRLRERWSVSVEFEVDLVEGSNGVLCGKVVLTGDDQGKDYVLKLQGDGKDRMNIEIAVLESDEWKCTDVNQKHGGTAHAEN